MQMQIARIAHLVALTQDCQQMKNLVWGYALTSGVPIYGKGGIEREVAVHVLELTLPSEEDFERMHGSRPLPSYGKEKLELLASYYEEVAESCKFDLDNLRPIYAYASTVASTLKMMF